MIDYNSVYTLEQPAMTCSHTAPFCRKRKIESRPRCRKPNMRSQRASMRGLWEFVLRSEAPATRMLCVRSMSDQVNEDLFPIDEKRTIGPLPAAFARKKQKY